MQRIAIANYRDFTVGPKAIPACEQKTVGHDWQEVISGPGKLAATSRNAHIRLPSRGRQVPGPANHVGDYGGRPRSFRF